MSAGFVVFGRASDRGTAKATRLAAQLATAIPSCGNHKEILVHPSKWEERARELASKYR
jgi:hypothetical protein